MSILNMECPICTEVFKTTDDIHSTSCGHIFHNNCLTEWNTRASSCPKCCVSNPTNHKLYLSFDEIELVSPEKITEMELKLKSSNKKNIQLLDQINETEVNFMQLQEQFTITERAKKDLEERIKEMNDSEESFLHLQGQYTELVELNKVLKDQIHELSIENEGISKELRLKCMVIESLRAELQAGQCALPGSIQNEKIRILEEKLKYSSAELEKEITNSTNLTIENFKLQSYIDNLKSVGNTKNITSKHTNKRSDLLIKHENQIEKNVEKDYCDKNQKQITNVAATQVVIEDLPSHHLTVPLENIIVNLATKMNTSITADDLVSVAIVNNNKETSSNHKLLVQFKNAQSKIEFLSKRHILKSYPTTSSIKIKEYIDDQLQSLLTYAKLKLKDTGFNHIFSKNNQIFAKKHRNHPRIIRIHNKDHVDSLQNKNQSLQSERKLADDLTEGGIDENYYQL